jgi:hypothetical protein
MVYFLLICHIHIPHVPPDSSSSKGPNWLPHEIACAAEHLAEEYPNLQTHHLVSAVNSAAPFVPTNEGHHELIRRARIFLRPDPP